MYLEDVGKMLEYGGIGEFFRDPHSSNDDMILVADGDRTVMLMMPMCQDRRWRISFYKDYDDPEKRSYDKPPEFTRTAKELFEKLGEILGRDLMPLFHECVAEGPDARLKKRIDERRLQADGGTTEEEAYDMFNCYWEPVDFKVIGRYGTEMKVKKRDVLTQAMYHLRGRLMKEGNSWVRRT